MFDPSRSSGKLRHSIREGTCWRRDSETHANARPRGRLVLQSTPDSDAVVERTYELPRVRRDETRDYGSIYVSVVDAGASKASSGISPQMSDVDEVSSANGSAHHQISPGSRDIETGNDQCVRSGTAFCCHRWRLSELAGRCRRRGASLIGATWDDRLVRVGAREG